MTPYRQILPLTPSYPVVATRAMLICTIPFTLIVASYATLAPRTDRATLQAALISHKSSCPLGSIPVSSTTPPSCQPCPAGYFHRGPYSLKCDACPKNTFNAFTGGVTRDACRPCGPSSVSSPGSPTCTPCKPGFVSVRAAACVSCPPGTALPLRGTKCRRCSPRYFSSQPNLARCEACPTGTTSNAARTECVPRPCPLGTEWNGYTCIPCPANRYRASGMLSCAPCPLRTVANARATSCVACPPGTSIASMYAETYTRYCDTCDGNFTTAAPSKPVCAVPSNPADRKECPKFTFRDADGDCNRCARDEFVKTAADGKRSCTPCPPGTWSPGGFTGACIACGKDQDVLPPFSIQSLGDSRHITRCGCPAGHVLSEAYDRIWNSVDLSKVAVCEKCPAGTYKSVGELRCEPCGPDEFSSAGAVACQKCPNGTYSLPKFGAACVPFPSCPKGFTVRDPIDGCVSGATGCPVGSEFKFVGSGSFRKGVCVKANGKLACTSGTVYNGVDSCIQCSRGFYLSSEVVESTGMNGTNVTKWSCEQCRFGTYSDKENSYRCKNCPKGFIGTQDRCLCDVGFYIDQHRLVCRRCLQPYPFFLHYDCSLSTFLYL